VNAQADALDLIGKYAKALKGAANVGVGWARLVARENQPESPVAEVRD